MDHSRFPYRRSPWSDAWGNCMTALVIASMFGLQVTRSWGQTAVGQLPTYHQSSLTTSLLVPDRGSTYAGGRAQHSQRSTLGYRAGSSSASGVQVSVYVHDFAALDDAILRQYQTTRRRTQAPASETTTPRWRSPADARVSDVRRRSQLKQRQRDARAMSDYALALRLLKKGKPAAAQTMFRNALRRAEEPLRSAIEDQLAALTPPPRDREGDGPPEPGIASLRVFGRATVSPGAWNRTPPRVREGDGPPEPGIAD